MACVQKTGIKIYLINLYDGILKDCMLPKIVNAKQKPIPLSIILFVNRAQDDTNIKIFKKMYGLETIFE